MHDSIYRAADNIRIRVLEHSINQGGGYMSQACSAAETIAALYLEIMRLPKLDAPIKPLPFPGVPARDNQDYFTGAIYNGGHLPDYDRFYLSPAHYALVLYAALIEVGRLSADGLEHFNLDGGSVEMIGAEHSPGMEVTTGSLGQGISQAAGSALARRLKGEQGRNWIYMSDGEFQIGQTWEALQVISHYQLNNIAIYVDVNGQQCDGPVDAVMALGPLGRKLEAFGMRVAEVDGHDVEALIAPTRVTDDPRPLVVLAQTDPCRKLEALRANAPKLHYLRFTGAADKQKYADILQRWQAAGEII